MIENGYVNPVLIRVHPEFKGLLKNIQQARVVNGTDRLDNRATIKHITKLMYNFFMANEKGLKMLEEVRING